MANKCAQLTNSDELDKEFIESIDLDDRDDLDDLDNFDDLDDLDALEKQLQSDLEAGISDIDFLEDEKDKIKNPECLGETIKNVIWEQFLNQMAVTAGEDFIKENNGLNLDLSKDAHIQTAENFANGKIATHNYISKDQLEQNYDRYSNTPHKKFRGEYVNPKMDATLKRAGKLEKEGIETVTDIYTGKQISTNSYLENGKRNPKAAQREHVKPSAELYENPSLQMANSNEELASIINDPENLQGYTTAERNNRKSDNSVNEMKEYDKTKHWEKANERAEEYIKQKEKEGEERLKSEGRKTQKEEAFRIGGTAARMVVMQLLAELMKEIIAKLVKWFKSSGKKLKTLITSLKEAITSFVSKLNTHLINAAETAVTTIVTAIFGPVVRTIKKVWMLLKQGGKSLKEAIAYIKAPENKGKPVGILLLEVGKIVVAGLSAAGAIVLGELIEKAFSNIPFIGKFEIPLLGSLANIIGIFLGAVVAGIIGAIAINRIEKSIAKKKEAEIKSAMLQKGNEILQKQTQLIGVKQVKLENQKMQQAASISQRHTDAAVVIRDAVQNIFSDNEMNVENMKSHNEEAFNKINESQKECDNMLDNIDNLLGGLL